MATNDTPRRIDSLDSHEIFEISLEVTSTYERRVLHTVADISRDTGQIRLTRTDNGYTTGDENGNGWKPYVETQRFTLSAEQMQTLIEAWQTVLTEEESRRTENTENNELPF